MSHCGDNNLDRFAYFIANLKHAEFIVQNDKVNARTYFHSKGRNMMHLDAGLICFVAKDLANSLHTYKGVRGESCVGGKF